MRHRLLAPVTALVTTLTLGACGDDDAGSTSEPRTVEITAVDFAFEGVPESVSAGSTLELRNDADRELHEIVAFRLDDESRTLGEILSLEQTEVQAILGEPTTVILAPPGSEQVATPVGDGTLRAPGRYALLCFIPTGVDPDEYLAAAATSEGPPDVGGGPPHIAHGMFAEVDVT